MRGSFAGIDPAGLTALARHLEGTAAQIDTHNPRLHQTLLRHRRGDAADRIGTRLATTSRWSQERAGDLQRRSAVMVAAQRFAIFGAATDNPDRAQDQLEDWIRGALGIWNGRADTGFPYGRWVFGTVWVSRVARYLRGVNPVLQGTLHVPSVANGWLPRRLAGSAHFSWITSPGVQLAGRGLSVGFSAFSTIGDAKVIWDHGRPAAAFEREGAGYVADWARLGFSASSTAFLISPNPVTGGIVIVSGVVWAGAEVVDHWDEITDWWGDFAADASASAQWLQHQTWAGLGSGWDWVTERAGDAVELGSVGLLAVNRALDWSGDRLADFGRDLVNIGRTVLNF